MAKKAKRPSKLKAASKPPKSDVPEGYTAEQWASYLRDPVSYCITELSNPDADIRFNAIDILRGCGRDAFAAIGPLAKLLGRETVTTNRAHCAFALSDLLYFQPAEAPLALEPLMSALVDEDAEVRELACNALGHMRAAARQSLPALRKLAKKNDAASEAAAKAIAAIENS
jgi:hypothetical protein